QLPGMAQTLAPEALPHSRANQIGSGLLHASNGTTHTPRLASSAIMLAEEKSDLSCPICELRKEKRFCPAVHGRICPQCCGEQREVALDCPSDCVYLLQAREHEKPRPLHDLDQGALFLQVEIGDQFVYQHEHLIMGLSYALAKSARTDRTLC